MCECVTIRGVDTEVNGDGGDALVGAGKPVSLCFNLQTDLIKVHKLTSLTVQELCIFYRETVRELEDRKGLFFSILMYTTCLLYC